MAEYVERATVAEFFEKSKQVMWHKDDVAAAISSDSIPTADVVEVVGGRCSVLLEEKILECLAICSDPNKTCAECPLYDPRDEDCRCSTDLKRAALLLIRHYRSRCKNCSFLSAIRNLKTNNRRREHGGKTDRREFVD